jgi:calcineurin-like phosphoesterase family protein
MAVRYISDLHFGHKNILRYDNRPWQNTEDMEDAMIQLWNKTVAYNDEVFILGDVVWSNHYEEWARILTGLNGVLYIVKGNHDKTEILDRLVKDGIIKEWAHQKVIQDLAPDGKGSFKSRYVVLNHSPMPFFVNMHHDNTYHLYGHVHISWDAQCIKHLRKQIEDLYLHEVRMYNVGCMIRGMDYAPRTLDEIIEIDKTNRELEEGQLEDYLNANVERGHDKIRVANKNA